MSYFAPYIDGTGLHMPTYEDRLEELSESYRAIFGPEAALTEAVPDYQLLSVFARALDDVSALVLQAYNSRSPAYAAGAALDLLLPQYGLCRRRGETDAEVRGRISAALAARGAASADSLLAAVRSVPNVRKAKLYVNDTEETDGNGLPAHSVAVVAQGGNALKIAEAIYAKKAPGIGTYGSTAQRVTDENGRQHTVRFSRNTDRAAFLYFTIKRLEGCDDAAVEAAIRPAVLEFVNQGLDIAQPLIVPQLYGVAYAAAGALAGTFAINDIQAGTAGMVVNTREKVDCAWNEKISTVADGGISFEFRDFFS